jgi:hypothetical protein
MGYDLGEWALPVSHLSHPDSLSLAMCIPPVHMDHYFEFLFPFSAWETGNVSLSFYSPVSCCSHSRNNQLLVCWRHTTRLINFTVTFTNNNKKNQHKTVVECLPSMIKALGSISGIKIKYLITELPYVPLLWYS